MPFLNLHIYLVLGISGGGGGEGRDRFLPLSVSLFLSILLRRYTEGKVGIVDTQSVILLQMCVAVENTMFSYLPGC